MLDCLIIDDEISISKTIYEYFTLFNLSCEYAVDFESGLQKAAEQKPALILLDVNLGKQSGFNLCKKLREMSDVPILFMSARNTDDDILTALGVGGDDYITKPFSMTVLYAKVKAMLKRNTIIQKTVSSDIIRFGNIEIEQDSGRVLRNAEPVKLKPLELKLLLYLIANKGRRLTKDELLEKVWEDTFIGEGTLSVHIRHLREKLEEDPKNPRFIKTMWGSGYMFENEEIF
ncbi:MAG: response regulator transcription factor [Lachnospiraceae bacterium]|nr:response regulator transcription factor [Lachnospiraceae bacterium]